MLGRSSHVWRLLRSPRLRLFAFRKPVDCVLYALLLSRERVRFIQIGSNDGRSNDPLWAFRRFPHWSGVLVEPVEEVFRRLQANYAPWPDRFRCVNAAIGAETGSGTLYRIVGEDLSALRTDQLSSVSQALIQRHARHLATLKPRIVSEGVSFITFSDLVRSTGIDRFELLHVDAEGSEAIVLEQIDFDRWTPDLILYEHLYLEPDQRISVRRWISRNGYLLREIGDDTLAVREDALRSLPALATAWSLTSASVSRRR